MGHLLHFPPSTFEGFREWLNTQAQEKCFDFHLICLLFLIKLNPTPAAANKTRTSTSNLCKNSESRLCQMGIFSSSMNSFHIIWWYNRGTLITNRIIALNKKKKKENACFYYFGLVDLQSFFSIFQGNLIRAALQYEQHVLSPPTHVLHAVSRLAHHSGLSNSLYSLLRIKMIVSKVAEAGETTLQFCL